MKAKIKKIGRLDINRSGIWKAQVCPHDPEHGGCGDWCPLFGEPIGGYIELCKKTIVGEIIDERGQDE